MCSLTSWQAEQHKQSWGSVSISIFSRFVCAVAYIGCDNDKIAIRMRIMRPNSSVESLPCSQGRTIESGTHNNLSRHQMMFAPPKREYAANRKPCAFPIHFPYRRNRERLNSVGPQASALHFFFRTPKSCKAFGTWREFCDTRSTFDLFANRFVGEMQSDEMQFGACASPCRHQVDYVAAIWKSKANKWHTK